MGKKEIHITENDIVKILKESIMENYSKGMRYRGCESIKVIRDEMGDMLEFDGKCINVDDVEKEMKNLAMDNGVDIRNKEEFNKFVQSMESDIQSMIDELGEDCGLDEGLIRNLVSGAKSFAGKGTGAEKFANMRQADGFSLERLKKRFAAAKQGFQSQKRFDELGSVISELQSLVDAGKITPDTTVGQLIGKKGRFGKLTAMQNLQRSKDSAMQNNIYR